MVGGYSMLDLASPTIYKEALIAANTAKPVMVKDDPDVYYADTISLSGTSVVITKGGKTITITDANAVSSEGDIQEKMIILDLTSYDLSSSLESFADIGDANEITEETFTNLRNIVKKAQEENKPLYYKVARLYDSLAMKGLFVASNYELETSYVIIPYVDITDNKVLYISIGKASDNKYYVFCGTNWIR